MLGGADQHDLARLAREMLERARTGPDTGEDGFEERAVWLDTTFGGAGRLQGDLTPACAAALTVVLDALGQKTGPEDTRTAAQRRHDAIEEACARLIAGQLIPGRDGQPAAPDRARGPERPARPLPRNGPGPRRWPRPAPARCT